jgi:geranylgeranyl reductase family protein
MDYDVIVVGAGPAGCATAYDLAGRGRAVLLLDRHSFPRPKACAGALTIRALKALRYSIQPVIRHISTTLILSRRLEDVCRLAARRPLCVMTDRSEFDAFCLERTLHQGAVFRTIGLIHGLREEADHVRLTTDAGTLTTKFLVGADGADSRIRALLGVSPPLAMGLAIEGRIPTGGRVAPEMTFDFGAVEGGYGWAFPKDDHINVGVYSSSDSPGPTRRQLSAYVEAKFGHPVERAIGCRVGLGGWSQRPRSDRIVLVGDAAGLADPLLGEGISFAIRSGQAAAASIDWGLAHGTASGESFRAGLRPLCREQRSCARSARFFYSHPEMGYALLTSFPVRSALIKGYASGLALRTIKRFWWLLPLLPMSPFS